MVFQSWLWMTNINRLGLVAVEPEQLEFAKLTLEASMESESIDRIEAYRVGTAAANACGTIVESVFQPPQQSCALKQEFKLYKQTRDEDASTYLSSKCALYDVAYAEAQRDHETLLTEVMGGYTAM